MAATPGGEQVYATLLLSDSYLPGALVLAHSLRDAGATRKLAVLITQDSVSEDSISQLKTVYDHIIPVSRIRNEYPANLQLMNRRDLHSAFTKISLWRQTQFSKIVYIDADVIAYRAVDELFDIEHAFSAAPDIGWPDIFNSGVMVLTPNMGDYYTMSAMADKGISFDGADQGLLNMYFKNDVNRLSFTYNVTPSAHYQYVPAFRHFQSSINMVHFIGKDKPWFAGRAQGNESPMDQLTNKWWAVYDRHYGVKAVAKEPTDPSPEYVQYFAKGEWEPESSSQQTAIGEKDHTLDNSSSALRHHHYHHHHHHHRSPSSQHSYSDTSHSVSSGHEPSHEVGASATHFASSAISATHVPPDSSQHDSGTHTETRQEQQHSEPEGKEVESQTLREEEKPSPPPIETHSWDAQWHPPPADSRPEAINFPKVQYEMSRDTTPFIPPHRYPSPPKDMWYEVPKKNPASPAQRPPAIFPWESSQAAPTRVFAEDPKPSLAIETTDFGRDMPDVEFEPPAEPQSSVAQANPVPSADSEPSTPLTPTITVTPSDPWSAFSRSNAWDEVPAISRYVDGMNPQRKSRGLGSPGVRSLGPQIESPVGTGARVKRTGFKLTDFPTAIERPSLPVTPAPIHRGSFFGGDEETGGEHHHAAGDESGAATGDDSLPAAEGVPAQAEWDPVAQLQKLAKQQSDMLLRRLGTDDEDESLGSTKDLPARSLPFGSEGPPKTGLQQPVVHSPRPVKGETTAGVLRAMGAEDAYEPVAGSSTTNVSGQSAPGLGESALPRTTGR